VEGEEARVNSVLVAWASHLGLDIVQGGWVRAIKLILAKGPQNL